LRTIQDHQEAGVARSSARHVLGAQPTHDARSLGATAEALVRPNSGPSFEITTARLSRSCPPSSPNGIRTRVATLRGIDHTPLRKENMQVTPHSLSSDPVVGTIRGTKLPNSRIRLCGWSRPAPVLPIHLGLGSHASVPRSRTRASDTGLNPTKLGYDALTRTYKAHDPDRQSGRGADRCGSRRPRSHRRSYRATACRRIRTGRSGWRPRCRRASSPARRRSRAGYQARGVRRSFRRRLR
jgi:hypothetical protein